MGQTIAKASRESVVEEYGIRCPDPLSLSASHMLLFRNRKQ